MDRKAMYKLSYGLFVLTAKEDEKDNGCIINLSLIHIQMCIRDRPFGVLNDQNRKVKVFIEESFFECPGIVGVHPNDNTATIWIKTNDLTEIIKEHGNEG